MSMRLAALAAFISLSAFLAAGCGRSGDLVLPDEKSDKQETQQ